MSDPLQDLVAFLTANTGAYDALGAAKYVILLYFYALLVCSVMLLVINVTQDRTQRRGALLWLWATRVLVGSLWFQGMLRTLPFGTENGLHDGVQQMVGRAALPALSAFVDGSVLPHFGLFDPLAFLLAFGLATAFILGLFVRLAGIASLMVSLAVWLGLYNQRPDDAAVWPWSPVLLALLGGTLAVFAAGRALGADAWIRRNVASVRERRAAGWPLRILT
ncbi:MAG: hypothetical protein ACRYGP_04380 [Janthinobacterium lividum]